MSDTEFISYVSTLLAIFLGSAAFAVALNELKSRLSLPATRGLFDDSSAVMSGMANAGKLPCSNCKKKARWEPYYGTSTEEFVVVK